MTVTRETLARRVSAAIAEAGISQSHLARLINIDPSALSRALSAQRNFKSLEIALIAKVLGVSTESLLAEDEPAVVALAARRQPDASPALRDALDRVEQILDLDSLLVSLGYGSTKSLDSMSSDASTPYDQGEELSQQVRKSFGFDHDTLPYELSELADFLEGRLGVDVGFEQLPSGLDGLSVSRGGLRLALVASGVSATRQRFTLAHELGHLIAGDSQNLRVDEDLNSQKTDDERRANAFAAAFLMPAKALRDQVADTYLGENLVSGLLDTYGVSLDVLAFRLHNLDLINSATRERIRAMSSSRIVLRMRRASDLQARNDHRVPGSLLVRAAEAYVGGEISIRPLANLLRVDPNQLLDELSPPRHQTDIDTDADELEPAL